MSTKPTPVRRRGKNRLLAGIPPEDRRQFSEGLVLAANPTHAVIAPAPSTADTPILVRTRQLRSGFRKNVGDRIHESIEINIPMEIIRALGLEPGMNMVLQAYGDGRIMMTRAGAYVSPEEREL